MAAGDLTVAGVVTVQGTHISVPKVQDITSTTVVTNLNADQVDGADKDTDGTLAANSDAKVPSQKAAKTYVDTTAATHAALAVAGTHGSTVAATANKLIHRDASGRAQIATPSAAEDIVNKGYADSKTEGIRGKTVYSSGSGQFQAPVSGIYKITIVGAGGGGGGAKAAQDQTAYGGNGGGGGTVIKWVTLTAGQNYAYSVGAGGAAGSATPGDGGTGASSVWETVVVGSGGEGGEKAAQGQIGASGSGSPGTNGDLNISGARLSRKANLNFQNAPSFYSTLDMADVVYAGAGATGKAYGGGGGGAYSNSITGYAGGAGAAGVIIIEW